MEKKTAKKKAKVDFCAIRYLVPLLKRDRRVVQNEMVKKHTHAEKKMEKGSSYTQGSGIRSLLVYV